MVDEVLREVLVRHAEVWMPRLSGRGRRGVVALAYGDETSASASATAVLGVVADYADRLRGRQLTVLVLADGTEELPARLGAVEATLPAEVAVHLVPGGPARLPVVLKAAGAAGAPLLSYLDGPGAAEPSALAAAAAGRPAEVLLVTDGGSPRSALAGAGFPLVVEVDLVPTDGSPPRRLAFGTGYDRSLEAFKDLLWAVDEYAGVRYRDPADPAGRLLDIALDPEPGPLRRELLAELARSGPRTVTELRRHALTATVYRSADVQRALTGLLHSGAVTRDPEHGRLGGDVLIAAARGR